MADNQLIDADSLRINRTDSTNMWQGYLMPVRPGSFFDLQLDEMNQFVAGDWTETKTGTGTTTISTTKVSTFNTTTSGASGDLNNLQRIAPAALVTANKRIFWECLVQLDDATNANFNAGLSVTNTDINTPTTSILFKKASGGTSYSFLVSNASTTTTIAAVATAVANTDIKLGFVFSGGNFVDFYVNDVKGGTVSTNLPAAASVLRHSYQTKAGTAAARTSLMAYMHTVNEK